jgi:hypothetical protein
MTLLRTLAALAAAAAVGLAGEARAELVTYYFTGTIESAGDASGAIALGARFSGSFTYDTNVVVSEPLGDVYALPAPSGVRVTIETSSGLTVTYATSGGVTLEVRNDAPAGKDVYQDYLAIEGAIPLPGGSIWVGLNDLDGTAIPSENGAAPPPSTSPLVLAAFQGGQDFALLSVGTDAFYADGPLSTLSLTPSPTHILAKLNEKVALGTVTGSGSGSSATGRLGAFRNKLEAAQALIDADAIGDACDQLRDLEDRCNGAPQPPDFIAGAEAGEIHADIQALRASLGCP